jgi:hypothetical protein
MAEEAVTFGMMPAVLGLDGGRQSSAFNEVS